MICIRENNEEKEENRRNLCKFLCGQLLVFSFMILLVIYVFNIY